MKDDHATPARRAADTARRAAAKALAHARRASSCTSGPGVWAAVSANTAQAQADTAEIAANNATRIEEYLADLADRQVDGGPGVEAARGRLAELTTTAQTAAAAAGRAASRADDRASESLGQDPTTRGGCLARVWRLSRRRWNYDDLLRLEELAKQRPV